MRHNIMLAATLAALASAASAASTSPSLGSTVRTYLEAQEKTGRFQGSVLISQGGRVLFQGGFGYANRELKVLHTAQGVFRIGSVTKPFTAAAVVRLQQDGRLKVTDPVSKYLPALKHGDQITIHHLLTHTSGLMNYTDLPDFAITSRLPFDQKGFIELLNQHGLKTSPGDVYKYNNSGYVLLALIVERVTGKPFDQYLTETLLIPGGMLRTAADHQGDVVDRRATGYTFDGQYRNAELVDPTMAIGAGNLRSTTADLARLLEVLETGPLLNDASRALMRKPHVAVNATANSYYGYGLQLGEQNGRAWFGHGGAIHGFNNFAKRFPKDRLTVVVTSNVYGAPVERMTSDLAAIVFGDPYSLPKIPKDLKITPEVLKKYEGSYHLDNGSTLVLTLRDGRLTAGIGAPGIMPLLAQSHAEFLFPAADADLSFIIDDQGNASGVVVLVGGVEMKGHRLPVK